MEKLAILPYDKMDFVWVSNHYDIHLSGLCKHNGKLCWFQTINDMEYNDDKDEWIMPDCQLYSLSWKEWIKLKWKQKRFEWMVGYHWTYPHRKQGARFYIRKPEWLYQRLFNWFYNKN